MFNYCNMEITKESLKFYIYDAIKTKEYRTKIKNNELTISEIMKEIDDDHIEIFEEKCIEKKARIGKEYQAEIPSLL